MYNDGLTTGQRSYIRKLVSEGATPLQLARKYGVTAKAIQAIVAKASR